MTKKTQFIKDLEDYLLANEDASTAQVAAATGATHQQVHSARYRLRTPSKPSKARKPKSGPKPQPTPQSPAGEPTGAPTSDCSVGLEVTVPVEGSVTVKVRTPSGMLGTMVVDANGVKYLPPKSKTKPSNAIPWNKLGQLIDLFA